ncbi:MAG: hypothetical protein HRS50_02415, partial [Mycoplasmataceae bacterium]|nr:hypothetical protein [Mycoplasmataceae bacterium]
YFEKTMTISSNKIEEAYSINEDLTSILNKYNEFIDLIQNESYSIRENHQTNFTKEIRLDTPQEIDNISIIKNTLDNRYHFVNADDKMFALNKREKFLLNKNKKRRKEMKDSIEDLEERIENNQLLDIASMKEDISLIKTTLNPKDIARTKFLYIIPVLLMLISLILIGGLVWLII